LPDLPNPRHPVVGEAVPAPEWRAGRGRGGDIPSGHVCRCAGDAVMVAAIIDAAAIIGRGQ
jgi:hypothetical protein